jgi:hypothetical protein
MGLSNAERQARWRAKRNAEIETLRKAAGGPARDPLPDERNTTRAKPKSRRSSSSQKAQAAHGERQASLVEAQRLLRAIAKRKRALGSPFPDLALFRQECDALGPIKVGRLLNDMRTIAHCLEAVRSERWREDLERSRREAAGKTNFTDEERRLILSTLHPDANASPARREAAFKAFNAKR